MLRDNVFSIIFPVYNGVGSGLDPGTTCTTNSNYYTSGLERDTCCCGCDKG